MEEKDIMRLGENETNRVELAGLLYTELTYSHSVMAERFYSAILKVNRKSEESDYLPILVSERLKRPEMKPGCFVELTGEYRSMNWTGEGKRKLLLTVFVKEIELTELVDEGYKNRIALDGFVCKPTVYRRTPLGREVTDLLLVVNRKYGKTSYVPCICWGRNAKYAESFSVGKRVCIYGRVQSRKYVKKLSEEESEVRTAYEVSVFCIKDPEEGTGAEETSASDHREG